MRLHRFNQIEAIALLEPKLDESLQISGTEFLKVGIFRKQIGKLDLKLRWRSNVKEL